MLHRLVVQRYLEQLLACLQQDMAENSELQEILAKLRNGEVGVQIILQANPLDQPVLGRRGLGDWERASTPAKELEVTEQDHRFLAGLHIKL